MAKRQQLDENQGRYVPYLVLGVALLVTCGVTWFFDQSSRAHDLNRLRSITREAADRISGKFLAHEAMLRGSSALFLHGHEPTREEFRNLVQRLKLDVNFKGTLGIGYARAFPAAKLESFLQEIRKDIPDFKIRPATPRDKYTAIVYLEPDTKVNRIALGFDMTSEQVRATAAQLARDTGEPVVTNRVELVQEKLMPRKQDGFLIYMPTYEGAGVPPESSEQRRAQLRGYLYSPLRIGDFLEGAFGGDGPAQIAFNIYTDPRQSPNSIIRRAIPEGRHSEDMVERVEFAVPGGKWSLEAVPTELFRKESNATGPAMVLTGGLVLSILVFAVSQRQHNAKVVMARAARELAEFQRALVEEEERYRAMVTEVRDYAIFLVNPDGTIASWNVGVERLLGYPENEFIGMPTSKLFTREQVERGWPLEELRIAAEEQRAHDEALRVRRDGSVFWASTSITPLRDSEGRVTAFTKVMKDLTAQKVSEELILEEKHVSETLRRMAEQLAAELDQQRLVQLITDEATNLIGADYGSYFFQGAIKEGEVHYTLSGVPREAFADFPLPLVLHQSGSVRSGDITKDPEFANEQPKLPVRSFLAFPVVSSSGEVLGGLFFGHSQTEMFTERHEKLIAGIAGQAAIALDNARLYRDAQKEIEARTRAEEQVRKLILQLEQRVSERTAQLQQAVADLQGFCYSVSHDLRTPLRNLVTTSRFLVEDYGDKLDEDGRRDLELLTKNAQSLVSLINALLEYARIGNQKIDRQTIDVSTVSEAVKAELVANELCGPAHIHIQPGMTATGDPELVRMVLRNLMENACKYSKPGAPVSMEVGSTEDLGERVFFVRDDGIGFDMAYAHKLFLPFERLHGLSEVPGTGIGLANVKRIVERHEGRVWAFSELGQGATFFFTLGGDPAPSEDPLRVPGEVPISSVLRRAQ